MSPLEEDWHCGKEQDGEVLQRLGFGNPVSLDDIDLVFGNDSFYVIGVVFQFVNSNNGGGLPTFRVDVCSSDLSLDVVLVPPELLLYGISGRSSATESWPLIDRDIPSIVGVLSKRALHVLDFSVPRCVPIIGPQTCIFPFERQ
ncbi:hypothetical protein TIFTF001_010163 [Ficus carica]|uniref:Uncharacterized protein n=1 Tax=Ficus carica TaxID=3494 RepID=A0AA88A884_FICCA|nr:hypothetical protein TIFTF001_010163 [Ficus carica]